MPSPWITRALAGELPAKDLTGGYADERAYCSARCIAEHEAGTHDEARELCGATILRTDQPCNLHEGHRGACQRVDLPCRPDCRRCWTDWLSGNYTDHACDCDACLA